MSDEAHFHVSGYVNKHNCRYWAPNNPYELHQRPVVTYHKSQEMQFPSRHEKSIKASNHPAPHIDMLILYQSDDVYCNNPKFLYVNTNIFQQSIYIY
jgi:hypothetical protein